MHQWGIGIEHEVMVVDSSYSYVSGDEIKNNLRTSLTLNTNEIQQFVRSFIHDKSAYVTSTSIHVDLDKIKETALRNLDDRVLNSLFTKYRSQILSIAPSNKDLIAVLFASKFLHDEGSVYHTIVEFATIHWKNKTIASSILEIQLRHEILLRCIDLYNQQEAYLYTAETILLDPTFATVGCMFPIISDQPDDKLYGLDYTGSYHINLSLPYEQKDLEQEYTQYKLQLDRIKTHFQNTFPDDTHQENVMNFVNAFQNLIAPLNELNISLPEHTYHQKEFYTLETEIGTFVRENKIVLDHIVLAIRKNKNGIMKRSIVYKQHANKDLTKIAVVYHDTVSQYLDARIQEVMNQSSAQEFYITFTDHICRVIAAKHKNIKYFFQENDIIYNEQNTGQFTKCEKCAYFAYNIRIHSRVQDLLLDITRTLRNNGEYHQLHNQLAVVLQWLSPLILSCYGCCDPFSIGDDNKLSELSCRLFIAGYSFINSSNINQYGFPTERHLPIKHRKQTILERSVLNEFAYDFRSVKEYGFGTDFRRYSPKTGLEEYQFGFELRIFDNFDVKHLNELLELIFLLSDRIYSLYVTQSLFILNPFDHEQLHNETIRILKQGWNTAISQEYFMLIRSILKFSFPFRQGIYASDFLNMIYKWLQETYVSNGKGTGAFSKYTIHREPGINTVPNLNKRSWEHHFSNLIWNPLPKTKLRETIESCYCKSVQNGTEFHDELASVLDDTYKDDIDDIEYAVLDDIMNSSERYVLIEMCKSNSKRQKLN